MWRLLNFSIERWLENEINEFDNYAQFSYECFLWYDLNLKHFYFYDHFLRFECNNIFKMKLTYESIYSGFIS